MKTALENKKNLNKLLDQVIKTKQNKINSKKLKKADMATNSN